MHLFQKGNFVLVPLFCVLVSKAQDNKWKNKTEVYSGL